jgi:ribonuclease P protein component
MFGRLTRAADFERLLAVAAQQRSTHFALHHLDARPAPLSRGRRRADPKELSTVSGSAMEQPEDNSSVTAADRWLGCVLPKRHAKRAVTRHLLARQIRAAAERHQRGLAPGLWLVRLRTAFDRQVHVSAASEGLRQALRAELDGLFGSQRAAGSSPISGAS